jgi:RNA polymerase sigma-70 factor (ECF subfamily)
VGRFPTTSWSLIVAADSRDSVVAREALAELCDTYWRSLYVFVRGAGHDVPDAQDIVQGFFVKLLANRRFAGFERDKGRFRSYLLAALKHYISDERNRAATQKRGGKVEVLPLEIDREDGERAYRDVATTELGPDQLYDRKWALVLLDRVLSRLRARYEESGDIERYEALIPHVTGQDAGSGYEGVARRLGISAGAVRVAVHRLRKEYFAMLRSAVADTVDGESKIDGELRHLLTALQG